MKILVFNLTTRWGMLHYSSQFCNELFKYCDLKVVIADYYKNNLYNNFIDFIKIKSNPSFKSFIFDTLFFWNHIILIYKILKFKPDIIHFIDNHPWYIFYGILFKKIGFNIYVTQHDPTIHTWEINTLLWKVASYVNYILRKISDKIFVHWDKLKKEVIIKYSINKDKVFSIKHWNYNFFKDKYSKWWNVENNTFLFFWRIVDYKWLDFLLDTLFFVKNRISDFKLIIAWPWDLNKYQNKINELKNYLEIYNYDISPEEAYIYFEKSEFTVLPYKDATWSWIIPLSYAFSRPVIVTDVWELPSVVNNWKTWIIVNNNLEDLTKSICFMLENKDEVAVMWKNWRKLTEELLWWDKIVSKIYNF